MGGLLDFFNYTERAISLCKKRNFSEAIDYFSKALEIKSDAKTFYNMGLALFNLGRFEEAIASYDNSIAINPNIKDAYHNKALALYHLKKYDDAISCYQFLADTYTDEKERYQKIIDGIKGELVV